MKTITSLSKSLILLSFICSAILDLKAQVILCNPDSFVPILSNCPANITVQMTDPLACGIPVSWNPPTGEDFCLFTNMLATPGANFFTYYDGSVGATGNDGQFIRYGSDSILIVGTTNGVPGTNRVFNVCFYATCSGNLSFNFRARMNNEDGFLGDRARFMLLNAKTNTNFTNVLTTGNGDYITGNRTFAVGYGDRVCFELQSDNQGGVDSITITDLVFNTTGVTVEQNYGPHSGDELYPGKYQVDYSVTDCAGNSASCKLFIDVLAAPKHLLGNCSLDTVIYLNDPSDCDTVLDGLIPVLNNYCPQFNDFKGYFYPGARVFPQIRVSKVGPNYDIAAGTDGIVSVDPGGTKLTLLGTNNGSPPDAFTSKQDTSVISTTVHLPCAGTYSFDWTALMSGGAFRYDEAGFRLIDLDNMVYLLDTILAKPPSANSASGSISLHTDVAATLFFFVRSDNRAFEDTFMITNFVFTPDPGEVLQSCGPDLTQPIGPGVYDLCYETTDCFGIKETCNFKLTVQNDYPLACKDINVSLDSTCTARITPNMLLAGGGCDATMIVELSHYGHPIRNPVDTNFLNKKIIGRVADTLNGYSCWSNILIEDKLAPINVCRADTIDCYRFHHDLPLLYSGYDCSPYTVTSTGDITEHLDCDSVYLKRVFRNIKITDQQGNETECTDTILVSRIRAKDITLPTGITDFYCDQKIFDDKGSPDPKFTGYPVYIGLDFAFPITYPTQLIDCNLYITYEDIDLGEISCVRKIMRTWTIREWICNTEIVRSELQVIILKDLHGPEITHHPYDFSATTAHKGCYANVNLPPIEAVDACHNDLRIDVVYPGGILKDQNGGLVQLPVGEDTIIYRIYDGCYNLTEYELHVTVIDETEPVAICDRRTVVSINGSGENWVPASVFDDGSFDECGLHHVEARRMDRDYCGVRGEGVWAVEVPFCCSDVGKTIMVGMRAIDKAGNSAVCMVMVEVQDKDKPRIIAPPDIEVDCRFPYDITRLGNSFGRVAIEESLRDTIVIDPRYWHYIDGHPFDGIAYDNCSPMVTETIDTSGMNQCGMGVIIRKFVVEDGFGNRDSAYQRIVISNHHPMTDLSIDWPDDFETSNICDPRLLRPEFLSQPYKFPTFYDDECSLVGVDYKDHIFSATVPGDPCYKIFREWKVIDWCYRDEVGNVVIFRDTQIIKVNNTVDPVITRACRDTTICSYDVRCNPIPVSLSIEATDFCTSPEEIMYRYKIDFDSDGTFDVNHAEIGNPVASGTWPLGRHTIKWEVEDRCGNTATCVSQLNLLNCKPPTAYAHRDLSIGLTGMDTDGDGAPDTKMAIVWASDLDAGSNHNCGYYFVLSFSQDTNDRSRVYTCDSIGARNVELWVTDINGNTSFVKTVIIVNDNPNQLPLCPMNLSAKVSGLIKSPNDGRVEKVEVELVNSGLARRETNYEGEYSFGDMPTGGSYKIKAYRNDEWLNGISTADIVKIQKHILGKELLTSGYQMIAADVNNSKTITSADIAELRKLILGITNEISKNTSWRFVHANYTFSKVEEALNEQIPEEYEINNLNSNVQGNFIGIKIGDLTNNAKTRGYGSTIETRSNKVMDLSVENISIHKGEVYEVKLGSKNLTEFIGFQGTIEVRPELGEILEVIGNKEQRMGEDNINTNELHNGKISISWNNENSKVEENLISLRIRSKVDGRIGDIVQLTSSLTQALSISREGEEEKIQLRTYNGLGNEFIVLQNEPNPWKNSTEIGVLMPESGMVDLTIYDLTGKVVSKSQKTLIKGFNSIGLNRADIANPGVYYYQLDYKINTITNKMVIVE